MWYFGEDTKEYDTSGNVISTAGSFQAGANGAKAGIAMKAQPRAGDAYRQEFAPGIAEDMATVQSLSRNVTVRYGSFNDNNVLETKDSSCLGSGLGVERKYYAPGVGFVLGVTSREQEQIELVSKVGPIGPRAPAR